MEKSDDEGNGFGFAVVYGRAPGGPTPGATDLRTTSLLDLHVAVRAAIFGKGCETAKGETVEEHLRTKKNSS